MNDAQQPLNALPQGHRLQEYELVRVLGFGGFGMTYLGFDHNLNKAVAIKEYLPSDIATRTSDNSVVPQASQFQDDFEWGLERFLDEARALARFDHRHIIKVYRFFEAHGTAYIVMEYAEGETLAAFLERKGTLTEAELRAILYPLLDGLEVVHRADFLHRDIKPGNIIIRDEDNSPVLLDFGSARQAMGARSRSVTSIITPGYAPIEQYSSRGDQGPWTDIYALGGVCYSALTGQVPDDATDRVRNDPLIPVVKRCVGQASTGFLSTIDWALAVDESDRPQSIAEWRAKLEGDLAEDQMDIIADETVVRPAELQERGIVDDTIVSQHDDTTLKRKKKKKVKLLAAAIGVFALIVVGVESKIYVDQVEKERQEQARLAAQQAEKQRREQAALEKQRQAFVAKVGRKPQPGGVNNKGVPDLHIATGLNLPAVIIYLLNQGADVNAKDKYGYTPLFYAASNNAREVAEVLLKHRADVNARDKNGATPLYTAASNNAREVAEVLLKHGADVNAETKNGVTPLYVAAFKNAREAAEVLLKHRADVNARDKDGVTPLYATAFKNAREAAEVLLNYGADVNAKINGVTPLRLAIEQNAREAAEVLRRYGGRQTQEAESARLADKLRQEEAALKKQHQELAAEKARLAAEQAEKQRQERAFVAEVGRKPQPRGRHKGETDLHITAKLNLPMLTIFLLKSGADINAKDNDGNTPLHWAAYKDASATAEVLLKSGANINAKNNEGRTPLHSAAYKDASAMVGILLKAGADVHAITYKGNTPLHIATANNASDTAKLLRRYGAYR